VVLFLLKTAFLNSNTQKIIREKDQDLSCVKRTQKDYSMSFKLQIVKEIEQGKILISQIKKDYGIQSRSTIV